MKRLKIQKDRVKIIHQPKPFDCGIEQDILSGGMIAWVRYYNPMTHDYIKFIGKGQSMTESVLNLRKDEGILS